MNRCSKAFLRPSLDILIFKMEIWVERQKALQALQAMNDDVLGDTESFAVNGDYFSGIMPNGEFFRELLLEDNVHEVRNRIAAILGQSNYSTGGA